MKAVVMETREKEAAILLKDGTFRVVKGKYTVGETIDFHEKVRPLLRRLAAAAAAVAVLGTGGGILYDANYVVYAEVSLDVNPSITYTVNKQSRVLGVKAVNEAAEETVRILEEGDIRFKPVSEAIERTMEIFESEGFLDTEKEDYVLVNVSADDEHLQGSLSKEVESGIDHAMEKDPTMAYRIDHSDRETAKRAAEKNMSTGRYAVWEQKGDGSKPEEYAKKPVQEILEENSADTTAAKTREAAKPADGAGSETPNTKNAGTADGQEKVPVQSQPAYAGDQNPAPDQAAGVGSQNPAPDQTAGVGDQNPAQNQAAGVGEQNPAQNQAAGVGGQNPAAGAGEQNPTQNQNAGDADKKSAKTQASETAANASPQGQGTDMGAEDARKDQEPGGMTDAQEQKQETSASTGKQEGQPTAAEGMLKDMEATRPEENSADTQKETATAYEKETEGVMQKESAGGAEKESVGVAQKEAAAGNDKAAMAGTQKEAADGRQGDTRTEAPKVSP